MQSDGFNSALSPVVYGDIALSINTQYNKRRHKSLKYVFSSSEESDFHPQILKSSTGEHPVRSKGESQEAHKPMTFGDLKQKDLTEPKSQMNPDPIFPREVDVSDLPSQYTEYIEMFRQVPNIPDP